MGEEATVKWYLRPLVVVLLLFFVLGPFGLPLLYKSPAFRKKLKIKIFLTVALIIYTAYLIKLSIELGEQIYTQMEEYRGVLK